MSTVLLTAVRTAVIIPILLLLCASAISALDQRATAGAFNFDCGPLPAAEAQGSRGVADWWEFVRQEHSDRRARLNRLSERSGYEAPQFFDACVRRVDCEGRLLDLPVLRVVFSERVFFDTDKDELRNDAAGALDIVAQSLAREPPDVILFVAGHTDSRGSEAYNHNLSIRRADNVARSLVSRGVGSSQVWRVGFGETMPIRSNATDEGRGINRRVEFLFSAVPEAIVRWVQEQKIDACHFAESTRAGDCMRDIPKTKEVVAVHIAVSPPERHGVIPNVPTTRVEPAAGPREVPVTTDQQAAAVKPVEIEEIRIRLPDPVVHVGPAER